MNKTYTIFILTIMAVMTAYFLTGQPELTDDGFHYEGFTESLARGVVDFKSYYGFMGLSILSVPFFWLTGSHLSIAYTSMFLVLMSVPLMYLVARDIFGSKQAGAYGLIIFLLTPYPYTTLMRGFQEGALLFFILLIIYGSIWKKAWIPLIWAFGGIVKPFALVLLPLFTPELRDRKKTKLFFLLGLTMGFIYLAASYYQVGHPINNAAINSYQGSFDTGNPPPLVESFTVGVKGPLRIGANLFLAYRKIMVSPFLILVGLWVLWKDKKFKYRNVFICSIIANFLLLSFMTFSFSKYLLSATTLISLAAIPFMMKHKWAMYIFLADSVTVFLPIWNFFGINYWPNVWIYMTPFWLATILFLVQNLKSKNQNGD
ncbi:MAG: hypothetical protein A3J46_05585 [Candidatus Yanofskybacteria bacterium RIFCSPHIGHO2_02_FULL_41_11]|uniref:Glycosyltransferase RgtA/B/C/D-like domain-containing protein n=1 Tax=Candidatus Yanofskybacteria bacterium RIFCSPHIGHO2_02_FULL_41_11 TaxID=1802675 RepID=A0A1F8FEG5_9BACT|nr:MAG: hypothetical protein A3J46_05585 [Candidatus Yanofskybacteria bacterium RIFCSPHIGHO2_02_FULL_41_11]